MHRPTFQTQLNAPLGFARSRTQTQTSQRSNVHTLMMWRGGNRTHNLVFSILLNEGLSVSTLEWQASTCSWCRQGRERPCSKWPSEANAPHHEHSQTAPRTHTTHTTSDKWGKVAGLFPTPWIRSWRLVQLELPVCVARVARARRLSGRARGAAREPRQALGTVDNQVVWFRVNRGRFPRSAKAQVLPERPRSSLYRRLPWPPFYQEL